MCFWSIMTAHLSPLYPQLSMTKVKEFWLVFSKFEQTVAAILVRSSMQIFSRAKMFWGRYCTTPYTESLLYCRCNGPSKLVPPSGFTTSLVFLKCISAFFFLQTPSLAFIPKSSVLVFHLTTTFSKSSSGSPRWSLVSLIKLQWFKQ